MIGKKVRIPAEESDDVYYVIEIRSNEKLTIVNDLVDPTIIENIPASLVEVVD